MVIIFLLLDVYVQTQRIKRDSHMLLTSKYSYLNKEEGLTSLIIILEGELTFVLNLLRMHDIGKISNVFFDSWTIFLRTQESKNNSHTSLTSNYTSFKNKGGLVGFSM